MTNLKTELPDLPTPAPMPAYILTPEAWAHEAIRRAGEYSGMVEGSWFLVEARRYLALNDRIKALELELKMATEIQHVVIKVDNYD